MNKVLIGLIAVVILGGLGYAIRSATNKTQDVANDALGEELAEQIIERGTDGQADIDISGDQVNITTDEGSVNYGSSNELPAGFPHDDVPHLHIGKITAAYTGTQDGSTGYTVIYALSNEEAETAMADYRTELKEAGFAIDSDGATSTGGTQTSALAASKAQWSVAAGLISGAATSNATFNLVVSQNN